MSELLLGCGRKRDRRFIVDGYDGWTDLTTLDVNPKVQPDVVHDLDVFPYPFDDDSFDEIHAYEVLEHCGVQGDAEFFFGQFNELWRILKPDGVFVASVPHWQSPWAWADPSHRRVIPIPQSLVYLDRREYRKQLGKTAMTDFRHLWRGDFHLTYMAASDDQASIYFVLRAVK